VDWGGNLTLLIRSLCGLAVIGFVSGCSITPQPLSEATRQNALDAAQLELTRLSDLGPNPVLDVNDVIARAVLYNSEQELESLEMRLAGLDSSQAFLEQLPTLTQRLNYTGRSNSGASTSVEVIDGERQPLDANPSFSTSSSEHTLSADITLAFSVLDFGLAFGRAERLADEFLIAQEKERQMLQNIFQRAQSAYWRLVAAERLEFELKSLLQKTQEALATAEEIERQNLREPLQNLTFQRELLDIERTLRDLKRDLSTAKFELDVLIGVLPGTDYALRDSIDPRYPLPAGLPDLASLEALALFNRSDLAANIYQERILKTERDNLLLGLLPSLNVNASYNKDFSPYLLNGEWGGLGASLSWDFLNLFRIQSTEARMELRQRVLEEQRVQIILAALALVRQSDMLLEQNLERFDLAKRRERVVGEVFMQVSAAADSQRSGSLAVLKEELNFLVARHRADLAYSDVQSSVAQMIEAGGLDVVPENWTELSIDELAAVIQQRREAWFTEPVAEPPQHYRSDFGW